MLKVLKVLKVFKELKVHKVLKVLKELKVLLKELKAHREMRLCTFYKGFVTDRNEVMHLRNEVMHWISQVLVASQFIKSIDTINTVGCCYSRNGIL